MSQQATATLQVRHWMTLSEASVLLGAHMNTVRRWVDAGAIGSYRTAGGHRRVAQRDVVALAGAESVADASVAQMTQVLDEPTVGVIEATLRGEVSVIECRLRLRALGRERGRAATSTGTGLAELLADHTEVRRSIAGLVGRDGGSGVAMEERGRWADGLADALLMGLSEGIDTIPERVSAVRTRRPR